MTRRTALALPAVSAAQPAVPRPNILFLMADQLRWDCLGAHGHPFVRTPNLDRLFARSADFSYAFVQSPVCVPSRVSTFTGRYAHSHKNRVNYTPCSRDERFLQSYLRAAGYATGSVGKLHYHPPTREHALAMDWDRVELDDGVAKTDPYSDYVRWRKANDPKAATPYLAVEPRGRNPFRGAIAYEHTPTAWTGARARAMLRELHGPRPFFLHVSFFKPHAPYTVPEPFDTMYDDVDPPLPRRVTLDYIRAMPAPVRTLILRGQPRHDVDPARARWIWRSYLASVSMVDREVGLILDELERLGAASNTVVLFGTDHGDQLLDQGMEGKNVFFEPSVRVPFTIAWPGRVKAGRREELVEMIDLAPTLLDFAGVSVPSRIQGRSLAPLLAGGAYEAREAVFSENIIPEVINSGSLDMPFEPGRGIAGIRHPDAKMVRTRRWKLNHYPGHGGELYDLESDPGETRNLFSDASRAGVVREMRDRLLDWMITADETDQIAPRWLL